MIPPIEGLERLRAGNSRFISGKTGGEDRKQPVDLAGGQEPFAVILGCSDSRVPAELVFDQGLGDLFVIRVAGNIADLHAIGSIEYAVAMLGTRLIVVLGHTGCGAVGATVSDLAKENPDLSPGIRSIVETIKPAVKEMNVDQAVVNNVKKTIDDLKAKSEILVARAASGQVLIQGAVYSLEKGTVHFLD